MHLGLVMECDYRQGTTEEEAFEEAFALVDTAEAGGVDGVWLAERHFAAFHDVSVLPKPRQKPHPPIRIAATTRETFPQIGAMGYPIFVGLRGFDVSEVASHLRVYRQAWREAGHAGNGDVLLRIPVYIAETAAQARSEPEASTMRSYRRLAENFARSAGAAGTTASEERAKRAERLARVSYEALLQDRLAYGTPEMVAERLGQLRDELGLAGAIIEPNVGGRIPRELVLKSVRLFAQAVIPRLR